MLRRLLHISLLVWGVSLAAEPSLLGQEGSNVAATKHNLTITGPGPIKVAGETQVCKFCHTPHASNPIAPLWNRFDPGTYYQTYKSTTLVAQVGQPNGASRLCLSCHDGTIALTQTYNSRNAPAGTVYITPQDRGYIGTDLSDDHPISFVYDSALATRKGGMLAPAALPRELPLDDRNQLQCTTCHDAHNDQHGKFLRMDNTESQMCRTCHTIDGWAFSSHATSAAPLLAATRDKWDNIKAGTVRQAACESCHRPHTAGGRQRLLRHEAEEDNCLNCHDGTVDSKNIAAVFNRLSVHPVTQTTGVHDPAERPSTMRRHVECADCHNPHRAAAGTQSRPPYLKAAMRGTTGVTGTSGTTTAGEATFEYQVCYKCHAGSATVRLPLVDRVIIDTDCSSQFASINPSFHPVEVQGRNTSVPSLLQPLTTSSMIYCTDCHSSDSAGQDARGPHGSRYRPLLVREYVVTDNTPESPTAYALCYGCHNRSSILADRSFSDHRKHVVERRAPCAICHDAHGVSSTRGGTTGSRTHLINFDRRAVLPSKSLGTGPTFTDSGAQRGSCTLTCHGTDHKNKKYPD